MTGGVECGGRGTDGEAGAGDHAWGGYAAAPAFETATDLAVDSGGSGGVRTGEAAVAAAAPRLVAVVGVLLLMAEFLFLAHG